MSTAMGAPPKKREKLPPGPWFPVGGLKYQHRCCSCNGRIDPFRRGTQRPVYVNTNGDYIGTCCAERVRGNA